MIIENASHWSRIFFANSREVEELLELEAIAVGAADEEAVDAERVEPVRR